MNPRHPAPKRRRERFFIGKQSLPARSVPEKMLSGALISTVSARSGSRYGRICGHKQNRSRKPFHHGARERLYGSSVGMESQVIFFTILNVVIGILLQKRGNDCCNIMKLCYNIAERMARFWACVSQALTKMVGAFAPFHAM